MEAIALDKYAKFMQLNGHQHLNIQKCGFFVHPEKGWLGATLDAVVVDPGFNPCNGLVEIKCPYTKAGLSIAKACDDVSFYCSTDDATGQMSLKQHHSYYHQVQFQLYVTGMSWCDFCVFTNVDGVGVERIYIDSNWQKECISALDEYFFDYMLPEIVEPKNKPPYYM